MNHYNKCINYVNDHIKDKILNEESLHPWRKDGAHVLQHALRVNAITKVLCEKEGIELNENDKIVLEVSALLHDLGKFVEFHNHSEAGAEYVKPFLSDLLNNQLLEDRVVHLILHHSKKKDRDGDTLLNLLKDADALDEVGIQSLMMCSSWVDNTTPFFFRDLEYKLIHQEIGYIDRIYDRLLFKSSKNILDQRKAFVISAIEQFKIENLGSMTMEEFKLLNQNIMNENLDFYEVQATYLKELGLTGDHELVYSQDKIKMLLNCLDKKPNRALELGSGRGFDAVALSLEGLEVDALEYVPSLVQGAIGLNERRGGSVNFIEGDFYRYQPKFAYDLVYYLDGFGVADDASQGHLLEKIKKWMTPDGTCLLEVYHPDYWKKTDGQMMQLSEKITRTYGYNYDKEAFTDTWCKEGVCHMQELKCYSVSAMEDMLKAHSFKIVNIIPGGALDYERMIYHPKVSLEACMSYTLVVKKAD